MERALTAQKVANELFAAEASIDEALLRASKLMGEIVAARRELGLSAVVGDDVVASVTQAMSGLAAARTAMVCGHNQLEETKLRIGIRTKMTGIGDKNSQARHTEFESAPARRAV